MKTEISYLPTNISVQIRPYKKTVDPSFFNTGSGSNYNTWALNGEIDELIKFSCTLCPGSSDPFHTVTYYIK